MKFKVLLFLSMFLSFQLNAKDVAIIGDSTSTGLFTNDKIELNVDSLLGVMKRPSNDNLDSDSDAAISQLFLSRRQKSQGGFWLVAEIWQRFVSSFLADAQSAWFNYLDLDSNEVYLAAGNGDKLADGINQLSAISESLDGVMPDQTFLFFSGLDLCAISPEYIADSESYSQSLDKLGRYISLNFEGISGKTLYVVAPLNLLQIVSADSILKAERKLNDESKSCKFLQTNSFRLKSSNESIEANFLKNSVSSLNAICPTLFALHNDKNQELRLLMSDRLMKYRQVLKSWVEKNPLRERGLKIVYLESTKNLQFNGEDIASDCFHLSTKGHKKIAKSLNEELKKASL